MSSKFYLNQKRTEGPYSVRQILTWVVCGKISINQNLYRLNKKKPPLALYKNPELKKFFPNADTEKSWALLKKYKNEFVQSGPYRNKGIQVLLRAGVVSDTDFVYSEGMKEWQRISICSEFHTPLGSSLEDWMDKITQEESFSPSKVVYVQSESWSQWRK